MVWSLSIERIVKSMSASQTFNLKHCDKLYIGGEWVTPSSSLTFDVINPVTEEVSATFAAAKAADVDQAVTCPLYTSPSPRDS